MTSASPERRARSVKFTIMGYRLFLTLLLSGAGVMFFLQALNGFHDGYAAAVIAVLLLLRLPWLGVVVEDDSLKVRTWLRTRSVPREDICSASVKPYSGTWARGGAIFWLDQLVLDRTDGKRYVASGMVGIRRASGGSVERLATALNKYLNIADSSPKRPSRHSST